MSIIFFSHTPLTSNLSYFYLCLPDPDPQSSWIRIQHGSESTTLIFTLVVTGIDLVVAGRPPVLLLRSAWRGQEEGGGPAETPEPSQQHQNLGEQEGARQGSGPGQAQTAKAGQKRQGIVVKLLQNRLARNLKAVFAASVADLNWNRSDPIRLQDFCYFLHLFCLRGRFPALPWDFLYYYTMVLQLIKIIVGDAGFEPGTSAPKVWCATNEPPHLQDLPTRFRIRILPRLIA